MSKKINISLLSLLLLGTFISACGRLNPAQAQAAHDEPVATVESFYGWYLDNLGYDPEQDSFRKPSEPELEARPELSVQLLARRQGILASLGETGGYDPLICAQDIPTSFKVELVEQSKTEALVAVETSFSGHRFSVRLEPIEGWQITEVLCQFEQ
jgi:hypothetical protein